MIKMLINIEQQGKLSLALINLISEKMNKQLMNDLYTNISHYFFFVVFFYLKSFI